MVYNIHLRPRSHCTIVLPNGKNVFYLWYAAGPVKITVDYIIVRQEDKAKVRNAKDIPNEESVRKHKLLIMDIHSNTTKRWHKKFEPKVHVWKLKEEKM